MATGTTTLVFSDAGQAHATVDVTGLSGLSAASYIEAFLMAEATADHSAEEIAIDGANLTCEFLSSSSFRIHGTARKGRLWGDYPVRWATA